MDSIAGALLILAGQHVDPEDALDLFVGAALGPQREDRPLHGILLGLLGVVLGDEVLDGLDVLQNHLRLGGAELERLPLGVERRQDQRGLSLVFALGWDGDARGSFCAHGICDLLT